MNVPFRRRSAQDLSERERLRFEYAWNWFNFHADQRTKMFNFMLIGLGVFAAATVSAFEKKLFFEATLISFVACVTAIVFRRLDRRNRDLYVVAMDVLINAEQHTLFGSGIKIKDHQGDDVHFGVARRIALDDEEASKRVKGKNAFAQHRHQFLTGKHRHWMPRIAIGFAMLFAALAIRAAFLYQEQTGICWLLWLCSLSMAIGGMALCASGLFWRGALILGAGVATAFTPWIFASDAPADRAENTPRGAQHSASVVLVSARFGGFAQGKADFRCDDLSIQRSLAELRRAASTVHGSGGQSVLLLVGATDRAQLADTLLKQYGSNSGLARARVDAVEECLQRTGPQLPEVVRLISGPAYTPAKADSEALAQLGMAQDREVRALLLGFPPQGDVGPKPEAPCRCKLPAWMQRAFTPSG